MSRHFARTLVDRAAALRSAPTTTESILWQQLRGSRLGIAFRRQVPIGRFIADFCAPSIRLILEVDGDYHSRRGPADARRDRILGRLGYSVVHIPAALVSSDIDATISLVRHAITNLR